MVARCLKCIQTVYCQDLAHGYFVASVGLAHRAAVMYAYPNSCRYTPSCMSSSRSKVSSPFPSLELRAPTPSNSSLSPGGTIHKKDSGLRLATKTNVRSSSAQPNRVHKADSRPSPSSDVCTSSDRMLLLVPRDRDLTRTGSNENHSPKAAQNAASL
jgi:hypothetical protein